MRLTTIVAQVTVPAALLGALYIFGAAPATAQVYGNPLPYLKADAVAGGLQYSSFTRKLKASFEGESGTGDATITRTTVQVGYGLADDLTFDGYLGSINVNPSDSDLDAISGTEFGVGVRKAMGKLGETFDAALTASFRTGALSNSDSSGGFTQLDVTYGGATKLDEDIYAYVGAVLSKLDATITIDALDVDVTFEGDSLIGVYGGVEFAPAGKRFRAGLELHLVHESGFGFYGLMNF